MKKLTLALLTLICSTMLNSCEVKKITGSEAAKILLAEERLDEGDLKNSNIEINKSHKESNKTQLKRRKVLSEHTYEVKKAKNKTGVIAVRQGDKITWSNFEEYSNGISYLDSFVESITNNTKNGAKLIEDTKRRVDSNDVWVKGMFFDNLLQVTSTEDLVMRKDDESYQMVSHTKTKQGEDCYDIFNGDIGEKYGMRTRKVGNHRYEYSYVSSDNDFQHHFIADNSRGYWVILSPVNSYQFSTTVLKDDVCYDLTTNVGEEEICALNVISSDQKCDILRINYNNFEFYAGAIANIESLTTNVSDDEIITLKEYADGAQDFTLIYDEDTKTYSSTGRAKIEVNLTNGKTLKEGDVFANGRVSYSRALVSGNKDGMIASFSVDVEGRNIKEKLENFEMFIKEVGIEFVRDQTKVINSIKEAYKDGVAAAKSIVWNDINIDSMEALEKAYEIDKEKLTSFVNKFEKVKDNVRLSKNQQGRLDRNTAFPYITKANFVANYTNNLINIESATTKINNSVLFENGNEYNLQFGLAQYSQDDGYFNLIPIEVNNQSYVTYNGTDELTVTADKLSFVLPVPNEGEYELVSYIADKEGIRVSRPHPITFDSVENKTLEVGNYSATVYKTDESLLGLTSKKNKNVVLYGDDSIKQYSYDQLHQLLTVEAFKYGIVSDDKIEVLSSDSSTWVALNGDEQALENGTYRLSFTSNDEEKAYVLFTY